MKGIANIISIVLILMTILIVSSIFFSWILTTSHTMENKTEKYNENTKKIGNINFMIDSIKVDIANSRVNITIKNNGKTEIDVKKLFVYLNGTKHDLYSYSLKDIIYPGENVVKYINCGSTMKNYDVKVTGPLGTSDEIYDIPLPC